MTQEDLNVLAKRTLDAAFQVHSAFGPGLLESAYSACLVYELRTAGLNVKTEVPVPILYRGVKMSDVGYRLDILIENELVVEIKALEVIAPIHLTQLVSYLKLADKRLGFLFNFNVELMRTGIYRRVHRF
jgi:GxxExxY protein